MSCTKKRLNLNSITTILKAFVSPWMFLFSDGSHFLWIIHILILSLLKSTSFASPFTLSSFLQHDVLRQAWWLVLKVKKLADSIVCFTWRNWLFFPLLALAPLGVLSLLGGVAWVLLFYLHLHLCRGVQNVRNPSVGAEVSRVVELGVGLWGLNAPAHYDRRRRRRHGSRAGWSCAGALTQFISGGFLPSPIVQRLNFPS